MIFNINSTRGQTRFLTCIARETCRVSINRSNYNCQQGQYLKQFKLIKVNLTLHKIVHIVVLLTLPQKQTTGGWYGSIHEYN